MPTPDQIRLMDDRARPWALRLWWALRPLTSVIRFMQSGAHPDDEMSDLLAALAFRDGFELSYVCATRGEGGQNDIGTETGAALGALRTSEMERAADVLAMRLYWLSESPDDPITDFGFSKSGAETLGRWGEDRTLARFVEIVRTERPDILLPTFLDVPGQHGHHRAMTRAAHRVMAAAADPQFPSNRAPWQVAKLFLPAWSGAGQAYDDAEPPPAATLTVSGAGRDQISGWTWARIGQQSRAYHRTQGMGRWTPPGSGRDWPLHLAECHVAGGDADLAAGLPRSVADLALLPAAEAIASPLRAAQAAIDEAISAFPDGPAVARAAVKALEAIRRAREDGPASAGPNPAHRLAAKETQLERVLCIALGADVRAHVADAFLAPGQKTRLHVELDPGVAEAAEIDLRLPTGWTASEGELHVAADAPLSDPYPAVYDPASPAPPALCLRVRSGGVPASMMLPFEGPPLAVPRCTATVTPSQVILNQALPVDPVEVTLGDLAPDQEDTRLDPPEGWRIERLPLGVRVHPPADLKAGHYTIPVVAGTADRPEPVQSVQIIDPGHTRPTLFARLAVLRLRVLTAEVPQVRVGYIGGGNDDVGHWLKALGVDVTDLSGKDLTGEHALDGIDSLVIGIFAMRFRPGLAAAMPRLHRWVADGGTLVTLYHRPWDNWNPDTIPPRRLEIGQPSLRWRVTDETAAVRHLTDHPILRTPNAIGPDDWDGWVKERGLYFARSWDRAYTALLEMADPGEQPHRGALLVADIGRGRHVHTSLILHHQMASLVPGAFRIMANLVARRQ